MFSHRIHGIHRMDWQRCSPTEFTEFTEQTGRGCSLTEFTEFTESTGRDVLPQNSRNSQNRLAEMSSHRFHRLSQMVCVWSSVNSVCSVEPPTPPVNLCKSVQSVGGLFSTLLQNRLAEMFSHRIHRIHRTDWQSMFFHRFTQMVRVWSSVNSVCSVGPPTPPVNL